MPDTEKDAPWWPAELGEPSSIGGRQTARYAYFPDAGRIAFDPGAGEEMIVLDTLNNLIEGFGHQETGVSDPYKGVTFTSQYGQFPLTSLPRADDAFRQQQPDEPEPTAPYQPLPETNAGASGAATRMDADVLSTIERLAKLRDIGALTEDEFAAKKADLLSRL